MFSVRTQGRDDWKNISAEVKEAVAASGVKEGLCVVFIPHTTAGVTINENADPDVPRDMVLALNMISPKRADFRHSEGNSDAHAKCSLVGPSVTIIVSQGKLLLGTWQGIYLTEFDGPRKRSVYVRVLGQ